jgi:hypothetical protein
LLERRQDDFPANRSAIEITVVDGINQTLIKLGA